MKIAFSDEYDNTVSFHAYEQFPDIKIIRIETNGGTSDDILLSKRQVKLLRDFLSFDISKMTEN